MIPLLLAIFLFGGGFFFGCYYQKNAFLIESLNAIHHREVIENETKRLPTYDACRALGGLPSQCAPFLRRLEETPKS